MLLKLYLILIFIFKKYGYNFLVTCKHTIFGYNTILCKRHHKLNGENKEYDNPVTQASDRALNIEYNHSEGIVICKVIAKVLRVGHK